MNRSDHGSPRLSGNQIVVIALALCAALVLAPVGVYAAKVQKVKVVGTVPTKAKGVTPVSGSVTAPQAPASKTFSKVLLSGTTVGAAFGSASPVSLTSFTVVSLDSSPTSVYIRKYSDAGCVTEDGYQLYVRVPSDETVSLTFPTPVKLTQPCAQIVLTSQHAITVTGYVP